MMPIHGLPPKKPLSDENRAGQINTTVGDLTGNVDRMIRAAREAAAAGAQVVVFPELSVTGYPPRDLVEKPTFVERSGRQQLERLAAETAAAARRDRRIRRPLRIATGKRATNSAAVLAGGKHPVSANQDAAAHLRRLRRSALLRPGRIAIPPGWPQESRSPSAKTPGTTSSFGSARSIAAIPCRNWRIAAPNC
jgi:hypothetical protein